MNFDEELLLACDTLDEDAIKASIHSASKSVIEKCLRIVVATADSNFIDNFLSSIDQGCISQGFALSLLREYACEGTQPRVIHSLQQIVSPFDLVVQVRYKEALRERGELYQSGFYVVDSLEPLQIKDFTQQLDRFIHVPPSSKTNKFTRSTIHQMLRRQSWINDSITDAIFGNRKLFVSYILQLEDSFAPSTLVVNEGFCRAVRYHNFSLAMLLSSHINQGGFDMAFSHVVHIEDINAVIWLLNGRLGFCPSDRVLSESYTEVTFRHLPNGSRQRLPLQPPVSNRRRSRHLQQQDILTAQSNAQRDIKKEEVLESVLRERVSIETREDVAAELRRRRAMHRASTHARNLFSIRDADIHSYSQSNVVVGAAVEDEVAGGGDRGRGSGGGDTTGDGDGIDRDVRTGLEGNPSGAGAGAGGVSFNEAVVQHIRSRIPPTHTGNQHSFGIDSIIEQLTELIGIHIPEQQQDASYRIVRDVLNSRTVELFGLTLLFLKTLHTTREETDAVLSIWVQGFLSESVTMHSCNPGAVERVITGLRGIGDSALNQIFSQAEAPHLVNIFLKGTFNIFYDENNEASKESAIRNAIKLAEELIRRDVTEDANEETIRLKLLEFARDSVASFGVNVVDYQHDIEVIVEMVSDNYETHLQNYVLSELAKNCPSI